MPAMGRFYQYSSRNPGVSITCYLRRLGYRCRYGIACSLVGAVMGSLLASEPAQGASELWTVETEVRCNTIRYLAQAFAAETGTQPVSVVSVDENEMRARYSEAFRKGRPPAIVLANLDMIASVDYEFGLDHQIASAVVRNTGRPEPFLPQALAMVRGSRFNTYFAVPIYAWVQGLWYRKDWFERDGLAAPTTWQAIAAAAEHFHRPEQGQYGLIMGTGADVYAEQAFTHLALSNGAELVSEQGEVLLDTPLFEEVAAFYQQLTRFTPPGHIRAKDHEFYVRNQAAMVFYSSYYLENLFTTLETALDEAVPKVDPNLAANTGVVTSISNKRPARFGNLRVLAFSKSKDKQERRRVQAFVEYLLRNDAYVALLHAAPGGMMPVRKNVSSSETYLNDPQGVFRRFERTTLRNLSLKGQFIETFSIRPQGFKPRAAAIVGARVLPSVMAALADGQAPRDALKTAALRMRANQAAEAN